MHTSRLQGLRRNPPPETDPAQKKRTTVKFDFASWYMSINRGYPNPASNENHNSLYTVQVSSNKLHQDQSTNHMNDRRVSKKRCSASPFPGNSCLYCHQRHLECSWAARYYERKTAQALAPASPNPGPNNQSDVCGLPPHDVLEEIISLYFRYLHNQPHSLFHEATFRGQFADGTVPEIFFYAVIGLSAR